MQEKLSNVMQFFAVLWLLLILNHWVLILLKFRWWVFVLPLFSLVLAAIGWCWPMCLGIWVRRTEQLSKSYTLTASWPSLSSQYSLVIFAGYIWCKLQGSPEAFTEGFGGLPRSSQFPEARRSIRFVAQSIEQVTPGLFQLDLIDSRVVAEVNVR